MRVFPFFSPAGEADDGCSSAKRWRWCGISIGLTALALLIAMGLSESAQASGLLIPAGQNRSLAIESQKVEVAINNGVAVTTVPQVFRNDAQQPLEA